MLNLKKANGITLIALIITIIVMIILVAVTVNIALTGGLFNTTEYASDKTKLEMDREVLQAAVVAALDENLQIPTAKDLQDNLPSDWKVTGNDGGPYTAVSPNENIFTVYKNGFIMKDGEELSETFKFTVTDIEKDGNLYGKYVAWTFIPKPEEILIGDGILTKENIVDGFLTYSINTSSLEKSQKEETNPVVYYNLKEWIDNKEDLKEILPENFPDISNISTKEEFYKLFAEFSGISSEEAGTITSEKFYDMILGTSGMSMYEIYSKSCQIYIFKDGVLQEMRSQLFNSMHYEDKYLIDSENKRKL